MNVTYDNTEYNNVKECCLINDEEPNKIYKRMNRGMSLKEAMEKKDGKGIESEDFNGNKFESEVSK